MNVLRKRGRLAAVLAVVAASAVGLSACGSNSGTTSASSSSSGGSSNASTTINVVGFSVIKTAYDQLGQAFEKTPDGKGATFTGSYGASGAQSRAVIAGQKADVVAFSLAPDLKNVAEAGKVATSWDSGPSKGIVSTSVVVISFRKGNPKHITGWNDIIKPGVGIVTADPGTSGSAKWNLLAAYTSAAGANANPAAGQAYLAKFIKNVVSWNDSGRTATDTFSKGTGDVLISYENEAIAARAAGVPLDYIVPDTTVLIQNPAAVTTTAPAQAAKFLTFVQGTDGQKILGANGFRPVDPSLQITDVKGANNPASPFPAVKNLITVAQLGGWTTVNTKFFDKSTGLVTTLRK
jgi:sulfate/thiosulfate-binding protein